MNSSVLDQIRALRSSVVQVSSADVILCEGPLKKQNSGMFGGWNARWFRLTNSGLQYFHSPKAAPQAGDEATVIDISKGKYFRIHKGVENAIEYVAFPPALTKAQFFMANQNDLFIFYFFQDCNWWSDRANVHFAGVVIG